MITYNTPSSVSGENSTFTFPHLVSGDNRLLLITIMLIPNANQTVTSILFGDIELNRVQITECSQAARMEQWYLIAPEVGTKDIVITLSASAKAICTAVTVNGADQPNPFLFITNAVGEGVDNIPFTIQQATGNSNLGIGFSNSIVSSTVYPGQTELWNIVYNNEMRTQAIYGPSVNDEDINISNVLTAPASYTLQLVNLKVAT